MKLNLPDWSITIRIKNKKPFTLLEVMVSLAILVLAFSGIGGWKMHQQIEKKRFQSDLKKLHSRFLTCHRLALNMQADWRGILEKKGKKWVFTAVCIEQPEVRGFPPLVLHFFSFSFNGDSREQLVVDFSATGEISPSGALLFIREKQKEEWQLPEIFQKEEQKNKKLGPLHPRVLSLRK